MKIKSGQAVVLTIWMAFFLMLGYILLWLWGDQPAHLRAAAYNGDIQQVERLLTRHPEWINIGDKYGSTALHETAARLQLETMKLLLAAGANVNATNFQGATPLHVLVGNSSAPAPMQIEALELLVGKGANVNVHDLRGRTPLSKLEPNPTNAVARWLREHGATD